MSSGGFKWCRRSGTLPHTPKYFYQENEDRLRLAAAASRREIFIAFFTSVPQREI
jgi:hypothetical protein